MSSVSFKNRAVLLWVYSPTTAGLDLVFKSLTTKLIFSLFFGSLLLCAASGKIGAVKSH